MATEILILVMIGAGCSASVLTRFIVWLDTPKDE